MKMNELHTDMSMISKIDNEGSLHRLNGDPCFAIVPGGLKSTHLVLKQQGDGARIRVALQAKSEVRLRAFGVVINHHLLVHVNTCFA